MAFPSPPPSALLFFLLLLLAAFAADSATTAQELEDVLQSLRNYGYSLFANGVATSDLKYELLAANATTGAANFTLFAARDELLYALDMAADAAIYVSTLRYHVTPHRHTFAELKNLSAPFLDTLLPDYAVLIGKVRDVEASTERASIGLIVDGVRIAYPDLFLGSRMAVHGIDGILLTGLDMSRDLGDDVPLLGSPAPAFAPSPASAFDADVPAAPPSNDADIPAESTQTPNPPTPPASSLVGIIPAKRIRKPNTPIPPGSANIPAKGIQTPNAPTPPAEGTEMPNFPTPPASEIDRNNVRGATAAPRFDWTGVPTISQDQIEKMKRLGMKMPGKGLRNGRRRYRRRRALADL